MYRLEDGEEVDLHGYWPELGGAIELGHDTGIFCIVVEGFHLFHVFIMAWPCASRTSHLDMGVM